MLREQLHRTLSPTHARKNMTHTMALVVAAATGVTIGAIIGTLALKRYEGKLLAERDALRAEVANKRRDEGRERCHS